MVTLRGRPVGSFGAGEGLCSGFGAEQLDGQIREFISSEVTHCILKQTPVIFGTIKEVILELLDERLSAFRTEVAAMTGSRTKELPTIMGLSTLLLAAGGWMMSPTLSV